MKLLDRVLQRWRIEKARPYISGGARVLDIGCADGALFRVLDSRIVEGVGMDANLGQPVRLGKIQLVPGRFPRDLGDVGNFDVVTMLAVLEHVPPGEHAIIAKACARLLRSAGRLILTVPSPNVDRILGGLKFVHLIDGMSIEQHYGFDVRTTPAIFTAEGFQLIKHKRFQFGLNNLFLFRKAGEEKSIGIRPNRSMQK
ncbi:MAG: methyltransferase domain-containing protein [Verrucomicrobiota bacterium]